MRGNELIQAMMEVGHKWFILETCSVLCNPEQVCEVVDELVEVRSLRDRLIRLFRDGIRFAVSVSTRPVQFNMCTVDKYQQHLLGYLV